MKFFKVFVLLILLGSDYGLEPASLEAFSIQAYGCDGRANLLFAPERPFLLCPPHFIGWTVLLNLGLWMIMILFSDGSQPKGTCTSLKIFVKYPSGKETPCTIEYSDTVLGKTLFEKVEELSGIPLDMQMLSYKMHLVRPHIPLRQYGLQDGCSINLSVKGLGGGGEIDAGMC